MFTIKELHLYSSTVRRAFLEKLASLPWEVVTKNREASYYSMKDIMLHMIDNEEMIVSGQILKNKPLTTPASKSTVVQGTRDWDEYRDMQMVREHLDEVEKKRPGPT